MTFIMGSFHKGRIEWTVFRGIHSCNPHCLRGAEGFKGPSPSEPYYQKELTSVLTGAGLFLSPLWVL